MEAGIAFSTDGKARAGMGVDTGDFDNSGTAGIAITNFDNEMIGLYRRNEAAASMKMLRRSPASGWHPRTASASAALLSMRTSTATLDLVVANGHIDDTVRNIRGNVGYAQPPHLLLE